MHRRVDGDGGFKSHLDRQRPSGHPARLPASALEVVERTVHSARLTTHQFDLDEAWAIGNRDLAPCWVTRNGITSLARTECLPQRKICRMGGGT